MLNYFSKDTYWEEITRVIYKNAKGINVYSFCKYDKCIYVDYSSNNAFNQFKEICYYCVEMFWIDDSNYYTKNNNILLCRFCHCSED